MTPFAGEGGGRWSEVLKLTRSNEARGARRCWRRRRCRRCWRCRRWDGEPSASAGSWAAAATPCASTCARTAGGRCARRTARAFWSRTGSGWPSGCGSTAATPTSCARTCSANWASA
ncbi:MAG: hypothetical protein MZW92_36180 [Comamonadaceae bacterium]|nr:hypothetical protein [Comamonadaceae bacterium]